MKRIKSLFYCCLGILFLSACTDKAPYFAYIEYKNASGHSIEVTLNGFGYESQNFVMASGESRTLSSGAHRVPVDDVSTIRGTVVFDETVKVECELRDRNLISDMNRYEETSRDEFLTRYVFTFTEADYEYAVSAGEIIGGNLDVHATNISDIPCACRQ